MTIRPVLYVFAPVALYFAQLALPHSVTAIEDQRFTPLVGKWWDAPLPPVQGYAYTNAPGASEIVKRFDPKSGDVPRSLPLDTGIVEKLCDGQARVADYANGPFQTPDELTRPVIVNGTGSLHHLSYFVALKMIERFGVPYALVQIDAHDDSRDEVHRSIQREGRIDCGNWITWLVRKSALLSHVFIFGKYFATGAGEHNFARWACPEFAKGQFDLYNYPRRAGTVPTFRELYYSNGYDTTRSLVAGHRADIVGTLFGRDSRLILHHSVDEAIPQIAERIQEKYVFISVDLDVLKKEFITTDWDNGPMTVESLKEIIRQIARAHTILGADICGISDKAKSEDASVSTVVEVYKFLVKTMREQE